MPNIIRSLLFLVAASLLATNTFAQELAPDVLVKTVSDEVLDIVRQDRDIQSGNSGKTMALIESKVLPRFNFVHMTHLAVARDWRQANAAQQQALTEEFRKLLVHTYSKALTEYKNQSLEVKPFSMNAGDSDVRVRTEIRKTGGSAPIALNYYLEKSGAGWKVYDIEVGGVSLVTNYRESFAAEVRSNGIDGLIRTLQAKNKS